MNVDGFARLLTDYCLEVAARPAGRWSRSTTLAAPLLLALQREMLEREAWPLLRVDAARARTRASGRRARDAQLDGVPVRRARRGARRSTPRCASRPPRTRTRWRAWTRRGWRAPRAPAAPLREARLARRWAITLWPTPARRPAGGHGHARASRTFVERALFLDRDDPVAAWGELREFQAG